MNTRLQVEHSITEEIIGVDLVKEQINIGNSRKLSDSSETLEILEPQYRITRLCRRSRK